MQQHQLLQVLRKLFDNKIFRNVFLATLVFILFHQVTEQAITVLLVKPVFREISSDYFKDIAAGLIALIIVLFLVIRWKDYVPSHNLIIVSLAVTVIYSYYRWVNPVWVFTPFRFSGSVRYMDVLLVSGLSSLVFLIRDYRRSAQLGKNVEEDKRSGFFIDTPVVEKDKDDLKYQYYAENIATAIRDSHFDRSFAIGITAKWGLGKTSFIHLVKDQLQQDDIIFITFNPWMSKDAQMIIVDFFDTINEALRPYHSSISRKLLQYARKIAEIEEGDNIVTKTVKTVFADIAVPQSLESLLEDINKAIRRINKKMVIVIDDVDRLDNREVYEVLKLIRNTANFCNTFFLVAYDREYVLGALSKMHLGKSEQYLEKVFQLEVTLPGFERVKLIEQFQKGLAAIFMDDKKNLSRIEEDFFDWRTLVINNKDQYLEKWIDSVRDVIRLLNLISINRLRIQQDIDIVDFIKLELLRSKYPEVYELLYRNSIQFFQKHTTENFLGYYRLKFDTGIHKTELEKYLTRWNYSEYDKDNIIDLLRSIFPLDNGKDDAVRKKNYKSVIYTSRFFDYFSFYISDNSLTEKDFLEFYSTGRSAIMHDVDGYLEKGFGDGLIQHILAVDKYENKDDFEKKIKLLFYIGNKIPRFFRNSSDIIRTTAQSLNLDAETRKRLYSDKWEFRQHLEKILINPSSEHISEACILAYFIQFDNGFSSEDFLPRTMIAEILMDFFVQKCRSDKKLGNNLWFFFDKAIVLRENIGIARDVFLSFIISKNLLDDFLLSCFEYVGDDGYGFTENVDRIFDSLDSFLNFLQVQMPRSYIVDIVTKFVDEFHINGLDKKNAMRFNFNGLSIPFRVKNN